MKEIWKDLEGYENRYQISNLGHIKSLDRKWYTNNKGSYTYTKGKILKQRIGNTGYYYVCLGHKPLKLLNIHRLVAKTFIPNPENKPEVNHIDGNKLNNHVNNLEWVTRKENFKHAIKIGLTNKGEKAANHKLTENEILLIRKIRKEKNWTHKKLAIAFNCCESNISYILSRKYWNHI